MSSTAAFRWWSFALFGALLACSARSKPSPSQNEGEAPAGEDTAPAGEKPRPTLATDDAPTGSPTNPFSAADVEIEVEAPADIPTVASAAKAPVPATPIAQRPAPKVRERFDEYVNVRALAAGPERIFFADMTGLDGQIFSKIRSVPLDGGDVQLVRDGQGRVDAVVVDEAGTSLSWVAMTPKGGPPALWTAALPSEESQKTADPITSDSNYGTANHLARLGEALFFVLPVTEQGRSGGIARVPVTGGPKTAIGRRLGPAFSPVTDGERLYFMAHQRDAPDVIYSVDEAGRDLRAHVAVPRGIVALGLDDRSVYWARIGDDGRSTEIGRAPKVNADDAPAPEVLTTIAGHVFETMAVARGGIWLGTSAAEPVGRVVHVDLEAAAPAATVLEVPRVWTVFAAGERVFVHFERPGDDGQAHRVFAELLP